MSDSVAETIQNLIELHQLEDSLEQARTGKTEIKTKIESLRAKLIPIVLGHHDRMRARGKKSLAEVRNGVCAGCHMSVAIGILATLRRMEDIQLCANCGRYLFVKVPPADTAAEAAPSVEKKSPRKRRPKSDL